MTIMVSEVLGIDFGLWSVVFGAAQWLERSDRVFRMILLPLPIPWVLREELLFQGDMSSMMEILIKCLDQFLV